MTSFHKWISSPALTADEKAELKRMSYQEQAEVFHQNLSFGTAGLRGKIGIGPHQLNRFTIRQTSIAFYRFLSQKYMNIKTQGIVVAYDNRQCSRLFAEETACIFAFHHIPVYLYNHIRPTPMLSFAIRQLNAVGGVMITASHNPPTDNGYKVYGADGAQLLPDDATLIEQEMKGITDILEIPTLLYTTAIQTGKIMNVPTAIDEDYYAQVLALTPATQYPPLSVVYTSLHGTGQVALPTLLSKQDFIHLHVVTEQMKPDPDFPTVSSPNPEEKTAFQLAQQLAMEVKADLILATDPDADRIGIMVLHQNKYIHLSGNEIGILLLHYLLTVCAKHGTVYSTIVSTGLTKKIGRRQGISMIETLTGFKYIAHAMKHKNDFLLGFEESYGYLIGDFVRDKDAIQTGLLLCHMVAYYQKQDKTVLDVLDEIYQQYGYHQSLVTSLPVTKQQNFIDTLFYSNPPFRTKLKEDFRKGINGLPKADVSKIHFVDGSWIAIRPSGTEPKVKIYVEAVGKNKEEAVQKLKVISDWIFDTLHG